MSIQMMLQFIKIILWRILDNSSTQDFYLIHACTQIGIWSKGTVQNVSYPQIYVTYQDSVTEQLVWLISDLFSLLVSTEYRVFTRNSTRSRDSLMILKGYSRICFTVVCTPNSKNSVHRGSNILYVYTTLCQAECT